MRLKDLLRAQRDGEWHRSSGQAFGEAHNVGLHVRPLACEERARPAPARHHFVGDEEHAIGLAHALHLGQNVRRIRQHATCTQYERFNNECCD